NIVIAASCPHNVTISSLCPIIPRSHRRTTPLVSPVATDRLAADVKKATESTSFPCPGSVRMCLPVWTSHNRAVWSSLVDASQSPWGLKHRLRIDPLCPTSVRNFFPLLRSHKMMVASHPAEAMSSSLLLIAVDNRESSCPENVVNSLP